ncbi:MAG: pilus assembly protein TadG-related protein [Bryobacteraceae bacterium]
MISIAGRRISVRAGTRQRRLRGYVLIAFTLGLPFVLGMVGLAVDLGTMYTAKNEAQSMVDSAALAAALKLNGTRTGVMNALSAVASNPKQWLFGTSPFASVTVTFGSSPYGTFVDSAALPDPPTDYTFAQVETQVSVPLHFLPWLVGRSVSTIDARAVAGRTEETSYTEGLFPFSPFSHNIPGGTGMCPVATPGDPFGFQVGEHYTLRWGSGAIDPTKPQDLNKACSGDRCREMLVLAADMPEARGFIMMNPASSIRDAIVSDAGYYAPISVGTSLLSFIHGVPPGTKNVEMDALGERVSQDTDSARREYGVGSDPWQNSYLQRRTANPPIEPYGNNRRVVIVPINGGNTNNYTVTGFARFFLDGSEHDYRTIGGNEPGCAEYIGPATAGGGGGSGVSEAFLVRLYQ